MYSLTTKNDDIANLLKVDSMRFFDRPDWQSAVMQTFNLSRSIFEVHLKQHGSVLFPCLEDKNFLYANYIGYGGPFLDALSEAELLHAIDYIEHQTGKTFRRLKLYPFVKLERENVSVFVERITSIIDLKRELTLPKDVRYEIRKAERAGVEVRLLTSEQDIISFYTVYTETAMRVGSSYLTPIELFSRIKDLPNCFIMGGFHNGSLVSANVFLCSGPVAYYWWSASNKVGRLLSSNYLVMKKCLEKLAEENVTKVDLALSHTQTIKRFKDEWGAKGSVFFEYTTPRLVIKTLATPQASALAS